MIFKDFPIITDYEAKLGDVRIYFHKIGISLARITPEENVLNLTLTQVYDNFDVHYLSENGRGLVGGLIIYFMSQGEEKGLMLTFIANLSANSTLDKQSASVYCKTVQYVFKWMKDFIRDNDIKDSTDKLFDLPEFQYSTTHFKSKFPD